MGEGAEDGATPGDQAPAVPLELTVVGLDPGDPSALVLAGPGGGRYRLRADADLRAALRRAGPATPAAPVERVPLRPRDIQARIRGGESAEEVAADAGVPVEHVRRYEGPVLAERAHVAGLARASLVRAAGARPPLEDLVQQRLTARGVDPASTAWDAWKREGSGWAVQAAFRAGDRDRTAQWSFEPASSVLEPLDDEARWLTAAQDAEPSTGGRRLAAVRVFDVEDDGGVRELPVEPPPPAPEQLSAEDLAARTLDLLDALRDRRGRRLPLMDLEDSDAPWDDEDGEDDDLVNALLDLPPAAHPPASRPEEGVDPEVLAPPEPHLRAVPHHQHDDEHDDQHDDQDARAAQGPPRDTAEPSWLDAVMSTVTGPDGLPVVLPTIVRPGSADDAGPGGRDADHDAHHDARGDHDGEHDGGHDGGRPDPDGTPPGGGGDRPSPRGRRRSSVPSWDEIVFGGHRTD